MKLRMIIVATFLAASGSFLFVSAPVERVTEAQTSPSPTPGFDQKTALANLREQIKGREQEPASKVFKNVTTPMLKDMPAARLLAVMEFGYACSLGVDCTHCHTNKWDAEDKTQKQTAREMAAMVTRINGEMLKDFKNLKTATPTINCTTCHRGEIKPALNLPMPPKV